MARRGAGRGELTERDRFWRRHLERQAAGAETSKAYAAREQLSIYALYQARKRLIALGAWPAAANASKRARPMAPRAPRFTRLSLPAPAPSAAPACRLRLASGVLVEWSASPPAELLASLVAQLGSPR
jgi:hypothetical protein